MFPVLPYFLERHRLSKVEIKLKNDTTLKRYLWSWIGEGFQMEVWQNGTCVKTVVLSANLFLLMAHADSASQICQLQISQFPKFRLTKFLWVKIPTDWPKKGCKNFRFREKKKFLSQKWKNALAISCKPEEGQNVTFFFQLCIFFWMLHFFFINSCN